MNSSDIVSDTYDRDQPRPEKGDKTTTSALPNRFTALDGLRGLAALVVVIFHLRWEFRDIDIPARADRMISGGYLMVDLFFVLSGFVLARTMLRTRGAGPAARFAQLRIRRFLPLHLTGWGIALLGVSFVAFCQFINVLDPPDAGAFTETDTTAWSWITSAVLVQGFVGPQFAGYAAAWSLSIELWTNILIVGVIALLPSDRFRRWAGPAAFAAGATILLLSAVKAENSVGIVAFGRGLGGLGAGMVTYEVYRLVVRRHARGGDVTRPVRWAAPVGVVSLLLLALACWERAAMREARFVPVLLLATVLVLSLALPSGGPAQWLLNRRVVSWLGSRSFAIYALHGPTLMTVKLLLELRGLDLDAPRVAGFVIVTGMIGALTAAELGHRYVERLWDPKRPRHRTVTVEAPVGERVGVPA